MKRIAFVMSVNPGHAAEYEKRHNPIWPELAQTLRDHGVRNYSIFHDPSTHQLFAYAVIEDEARWSALAGTEVCRRWWRYMTEVLVCERADSPKAKEEMLREVFHLD